MPRKKASASKASPGRPSKKSATAQQPPPPELALRRDLLAAFAADVEAEGLVGERANAQIVFLALVSRRLDQLVSVAVKGASSSGKSELVKRVLAFFPPSAYLPVTAMSDKWLAYVGDSLSHRFLVIYEASGCTGDFATYALRSLLSEGSIQYGSLEVDGNGRWQNRPKLVEGPTGLIVTTTRLQLHPENETRLLTLTVDDSPEQTHRVLEAVALAATGRSRRRRADLEAWHELQRWLESAASEVDIPFASLIVPPLSSMPTRIRRDFNAILVLIRAHALLHQAGRTIKHGVVEASLEDYRVVRGLIRDVIAQGAEAAVPPEVREVVELVEEFSETTGGSVKQSALVSRLGLHKSNVHRRVARALELGYLRDLEGQPGRPARLVPGDPLPADIDFLPDPGEVEAKSRSRVRKKKNR